MALLKCPLEGWIFGAQRAKNETPPWNSKTKSQRSEPKWLLKYLITPICAKFQPNRLTTTFGPWNAYFSDSDTFKIIAHIMFVHDHFAKENPNSSCLKQFLSFLLRGNSDAQGVSIGWIKSHQLTLFSGKFLKEKSIVLTRTWPPCHVVKKTKNTEL